jgi:endonuclease III
MLHHQKAARIKQILNRIKKREGDLTLSFLANYTLNEMMTWLLASPGIGPNPHEQMNAILPRDPLFMKQLHLQLIRFGQELCHPQRPACSQCLVRDLCNWHLKWVSGREGCPFAYR